MLELLMRDVIISHPEDGLLPYDLQIGFRKGRSCLTKLLVYLDRVTDIVDEEDNVDIIYLDLKNAFDKLTHHRLMSKLLNNGINGELRDWIAA